MFSCYFYRGAEAPQTHNNFVRLFHKQRKVLKIIENLLALCSWLHSVRKRFSIAGKREWQNHHSSRFNLFIKYFYRVVVT